MPAIAITTTLNTLNCAACAMLFAIPADFEQRRREDHGEFRCPAGHVNVFYGKTEAERLREQLAAKEREVLAAKSRADTERAWRLDEEKQRKAAERSVRGHKAVVTRMKKRVAAVSCPCCSKKFKNLEEHMKAEHPKWDPDRAATELAAKSDA